jgi:hypothetical protein
MEAKVPYFLGCVANRNARQPLGVFAQFWDILRARRGQSFSGFFLSPLLLMAMASDTTKTTPSAAATIEGTSKDEVGGGDLVREDDAPSVDVTDSSNSTQGSSA